MSLFLALALTATTFPADARPRVLVVVGAPGTDEYGTVFAKSAELWEAAAKKGSPLFR